MISFIIIIIIMGREDEEGRKRDGEGRQGGEM